MSNKPLGGDLGRPTTHGQGFSHHGHGHHARRPVIGITPDHAVRAESGLAFYELKVAYADAVLRAGGLPFVLPYSDDPTTVDAFLDRVSGLLVTGGPFDIAPERYGQTAKEGLGTLKPLRTEFETALLNSALRRHIPILGICGGMQLLNVVLGGTLVQDILREIPNAKDHEQKHDRQHPAHPVDVREGTQLAEMMGKGQVMVNSTHHQAVKTAGDNVVVSALSPDGVVEAIEFSSHPFAIGVQWHPELLIQSVPLHLSIYKMLVHKAREMRR
jgi:putative glutamine amidotransferase